VYCVELLPDTVVGEIGYLLASIHWSFASWQPEQLAVTPLWIIAVVGTGVANAVPGAVAVALAATSAAGIEPRWQVSQAVADGMCEETPTGAVGGITTIRVMPTNEAPVTVGPWQLTQVVMPLWLIAEFLKVAPFGTGVVGTLEPAPTWQASQEALVGTWFAGVVTIEKFAAGIAKVGAVVEPWHCVQFAVVLGAYRWMFASVGIAEKSVPVWQFVHCAVAEVGMWFAGLIWPEKNVVPVWHCEQSPLDGCAASATL
jgi:hypothetical protein